MTIVVGETMKQKYLKHTSRIEVITNGYDTIKNPTTQKLDSNFSITHVGSMNYDRNPKILWQVLKEICDINSDFKKDLRVKFIGKIDDSVIQDVKVFDNNNVIRIPYVEHSKVNSHQVSSQVLLLCINNVPSAKGIITGKIFEYLQAKRPILSIGPEDGDAAIILKNTNAGTIVDFNDKKRLKAIILDLYEKYKAGNLQVDLENINQYHRKNITSQLAEVIKKVVY